MGAETVDAVMGTTLQVCLRHALPCTPVDRREHSAYSACVIDDRMQI
jgi:hypothetical protein